ncbi:MAG: SpaH/EbpB family LPXTG-anchored major pilin, partial [Oscillospiraceae bacterium]|nr:SpaH/EbpB family LPXTG-anchored major pilin [Oscillospiraceae bacterium]
SVMAYGFEENDTSSEFLEALGLDYTDAYHNDGTTHYFVADTISTALSAALAANSTSVKNEFESFIAAGTAMTETDVYGNTKAENLELGLYLVVETKVPENVTATCDPFIISLPMTSADGASWNYDVTVYPKNTTGMPTLEKGVREAVASNGKTHAYTEIATASDGDTLEYQIISKLPSITSASTYLSEYSFADQLASGISYKKNDVIIEIYKDEALEDKVATWDEASGKFTVNYDDNKMNIAMAESGLAEINTASAVHTSSINSGYSDCIMRITYAAKLNSDASVVYGSTGNPNTVTLTWKRTNADYSDTLEDSAAVYTYGIDLTKKFSDGKGDLSKVKFIIENNTDICYVTAQLKDGIYYVTGFDADKDKATVFAPNSNGHIIVKGLEDDSYILTETATDEGYTPLKSGISIVINAADGVASGKVNNKDVTMTENNSLVPLGIVNTRGFNLPQTGSYGTWMFTVGGILAMGVAVIIILRASRKQKSM